ncbi:hypothetical protein H0H92_001471 [Tricholoma furcatifolium]|nr:hypothetical protein H0H92_001471 [Tricholoma furcatifolium]
MLIKSLLLVLSFVNLLVSAAPLLSSQANQPVLPNLYPRNNNEQPIPAHGEKVLWADITPKERKNAVAFAESIPVDKLPGIGNKRTIYSQDAKGNAGSSAKQMTGFRLDIQGTIGNLVNYQIQRNGVSGLKTSVGGVLCDPTVTGHDLKQELIKAVKSRLYAKKYGDYMSVLGTSDAANDKREEQKKDIDTAQNRSRHGEGSGKRGSYHLR